MNLFKRKENYKVFVSLMFMQLIPFFYTLIRTSLVNSIPDDASLNIIGQIEWFDLIDETLQAFLIMTICMEFGFGMVFGLLIDIAIVFSLKRKKQVSA